MELTVHDHAVSFLACAGVFLSAAEAENSIMATPAARMVEAPRDDDAGSYFATATDSGTVVAAAFLDPDGGLLLTAGPDSALALIAADLADRGRTLRRMVGPLAACEALASHWRERTGQAHVLRYHLRHFELRQPPRPQAASGRLRTAAAAEQELVVDWAIAFIAEVGHPDDPTQARRKTLQRIERGQMRVWDDGGVVSYAGYSEARADTARIAPVYTPPRFRRRGYASALVAGLSAELFARGKRAIFLTTDVANPTSNDIYSRIGYRPVADHFRFDFVPKLA